VVFLIGPADAVENLEGLLDGRLIDGDRLEPALEGGVALDVLAVFVQRGRADDLQLAAREGRLKDVGSVHRGPGRTGANQHVNLIDEEDRAGGFKLIDNPFEPLLELTTVHRPGNQRADIQLQDTFAEQRGRHVGVDDALSQSLDDGCFANAGFTDQNRIIFIAAGKNLNDPLDFHLTPDDGIKFILFGH